MAHEGNQITCLTNRQFYVRHKKSPEDPNPNMNRVLKILIKNQNRQKNVLNSTSKRVATEIKE